MLLVKFREVLAQKLDAVSYDVLLYPLDSMPSFV